jgi:hypothetical protein
MTHDLGAAALQGRRTALAVRWTEGRDGAVRATWCPLGGHPIDLDVRPDGGRWVATVRRWMWPRLHHVGRFDTRDEGQLWCEETAWTIRGEEMER